MALQSVSTLVEHHRRGRPSRESLLLDIALSVSVSLPFALRCVLAIHCGAIGSGFQEALDRGGKPFDFRLASLGHVAPTLILLELTRGHLTRVVALAGVEAGSCRAVMGIVRSAPRWRSGRALAAGARIFARRTREHGRRHIAMAAHEHRQDSLQRDAPA